MSSGTALASLLWGTLLAVCTISFSLPLSAQPASNSINTQREAMRKFSSLVGHWSGPVTITRVPGEALHLTQAENVEYKLDGLVLLIEGKSTNAEGKVLFSALATVAYDDSTHAYRFRAYHGGHYLDTELSVSGNGFSWNFTVGPVHVVNTMHLTAKGEWDEVTETTMGNNPSRRSVEMRLQRLS